MYACNQFYKSKWSWSPVTSSRCWVAVAAAEAGTGIRMISVSDLHSSWRASLPWPSDPPSLVDWCSCAYSNRPCCVAQGTAVGCCHCLLCTVSRWWCSWAAVKNDGKCDIPWLRGQACVLTLRPLYLRCERRSVSVLPFIPSESTDDCMGGIGQYTTRPNANRGTHWNGHPTACGALSISCCFTQFLWSGRQKILSNLNIICEEIWSLCDVI